MYFNAENKSIGEDLFLRTKVKCVFSSLFTQNIAHYHSTKHTYDKSARKNNKKQNRTVRAVSSGITQPEKKSNKVSRYTY